METIRRPILALLLSLFAGFALAGPVDINTADAATLAREIKGVGPKTAEAIIAYREAHSGFKSVDELLNVKGIGAKTLDKNRDNLTVDKE